MKKSAEFWNKDYKRRPSFKETASENPSNAVVKFVDFLSQKNVPAKGWLMDVGCAYGRNSIYLTQQGFQVVGVDISDVAIKRARARTKKAGLRVDYKVLDISTPWPFNDNSFDFVMDIATSHLLTDQETSFYRDELLRVLKPGGRFLLYTLDRMKDREAQQLIKEYPGPEKNTYVIPQTGVVEKTFTLAEIASSYVPLHVEAQELIYHPTEFKGKTYKRYFWWIVLKNEPPIRLKLQKVLKVKPTKPFAFDPTFHKPDHFTSGDNYWEQGIRWQTWNWQGKPLGIKFSNKGTLENPLVEIKIYAKDKPANSFVGSLIEEIKYLYNFNLDLNDFYNTFKKDDFLSPILKKWRGMRPGHPSCLYEYLMIGMVLQNASVRRSVQMFKALLENYGTLIDFDGKKLWCFWSPGRLQSVSIDDLRALKVGYRAKSIRKIDDNFSHGLIDEYELRKKDRDMQMMELLKLYGVGPATVWYLLFDVFHHWDFFNHVSPWEQKIYSKLFFNRNPENPVPVKKLLKHFEKFGKYKQLAVHYIWEDLFWKRKNGKIPWLEKEIRL